MSEMENKQVNQVMSIPEQNVPAEAPPIQAISHAKVV